MSTPASSVPVSPTDEDERFRVLFDHSSDAHLIFDKRGILDCNNAAIALLGCADKSEVLGLHPASLSPDLQPDGRRSDEKSVEMDGLARARGYHRFEWQHRKVNGEVFPVEVTLTPVRLRSGPAMLVVWHDLTEQNRLAAQLRQSIARFDLMVEGASIGIWEVKLHPGRAVLRPEDPVYWSPRFAQLLSFDGEEFPPVFASWERLLHPDDRAATICAMQDAIAQLRPYSVDYRVRTKSGAYRWFHGTGAVGLDHQGNPERFAGSIVDITDRKDAEAASNASAERFRQLSASAPVGIYLTDAQGSCLYVNAEWSRITGLSPQESFADGWSKAIHPDDQAAVFSDWAESAPAGRPFEREIRWLRPTGEVRWTISRAVALRNEAGDCTGFVGSNQDITDRKRSDAEIERLKNNLHDAIENLDSGLVMFDADERLVMSNQKYRELYSTSQATIQVGVTFEELLRAFYASNPAGVQVMLNGQSLDERIAERLASFRRAEKGNLQYIGDRWVRVDERRTNRGGIVSLRTDVTELVLNEERLRAALAAAEAATKAKGEFLATMSHEIRTPMNGVIGMAGLLVNTELDAQQREYAETIRSCGEGLHALINDVLDFSKLEAGKFDLEKTPFRLQQIIDEILPIFAEATEKRGVRLGCHWATSVPDTLLGDPTRVRQVLLNLVSNAVKFTHEGSVQLRVSCSPLGSGAHRIVMEVVDTGIGMSPTQVENIGQPFTQADASMARRYGGTGLGISICRGLIEKMNGVLELSSVQGVGTKFRVELEFNELAGASAAAKVLATPPIVLASPVNIPRVLVVEDNPVNQRLITLLLRKHAEQVVVASNGGDAMARFQEGTFSCVLMDCQMPDIDGFEATRQIRAWEQANGLRPTPIIALTANALSGDREACLAAGMDDYLSKPLRAADLCAVLSRQVLPAL